MTMPTIRANANTASGWTRIGMEVRPAQLVDARVQLHWAAQVPAAVADASLEPAADDSHTNLEWWSPVAALVGHALPGRVRIGLRPRDLTLLMLGPTGQVDNQLALDGQTMEQALRWAQGAIADVTGHPPERPPELRGYDMPDHPVGHGAAWSTVDAGGSAAFCELAVWYANADRALLAVSSERSAWKPAPVRCWPHHFDIATILFPHGKTDPKTAPQIGVGLSPGDGSYAEPYWYVTPSPIPDSADIDALPPLPAQAEWRTTGWRGAVLTGTKVMRSGLALEQAANVHEFLDIAVTGGAELIAP